MVQEKVTRKELREMHIGQTRIFTFSDARKVHSARVTCGQMRDLEGLEFAFKPDYKAKSACITRIK